MSCKTLQGKYAEKLEKEIKKMNKEIEQLKIDNQELLEDNAWWQRRFNAVQRDYENLQAKIDKAKEYLEKFIPIDNDTIILSERQRDYLLEILGDKENVLG